MENTKDSQWTSLSRRLFIAFKETAAVNWLVNNASFPGGHKERDAMGTTRSAPSFTAGKRLRCFSFYSIWFLYYLAETCLGQDLEKSYFIYLSLHCSNSNELLFVEMLRARVELWSWQFNYGADINPSQSVFRRLEHFLSTSKYIKLWQATERKTLSRADVAEPEL